MTKKKTKISKTAYILLYPGNTAAELVEMGAHNGMKFSQAYVHSVRSKASKKGSPKKPAAVKEVGKGLTVEARLRELVLDLGRDRAREIIAESSGLAGQSMTSEKEDEFLRFLNKGRENAMLAACGLEVV
jgi:hypothetical protein